MKKEFKLIDWRAEMFGEGVYPESKVKESFKLLKEDFKDCKAIPKLCLPFIFEIIENRTGFKEDGGEDGDL